jgi:SAM-dependent methyltransferase
MILNLCSGDYPIPGAVNVDFMTFREVDYVCDLTKIPWPWKDNSIDKIYITHGLEHFEDHVSVLNECYRILKVGGILEIIVPHASSPVAVGCLGHYRTYSYDTLNYFLSNPNYLFPQKKFETVYRELRWWSGRSYDNGTRGPVRLLLIPLNFIINNLIKLSTKAFENCWWGLVGGCREVLWIGRKV